MFKHDSFRPVPFEMVPLDRDIFLMSDQWMEPYEKMWLDAFDGHKNESVGYISYASVNAITKTALNLTWYANTHNRFHAMSVSLPRDQFVRCIEIPEYDEKPHIFVKDAWLRQIHLSQNSVFAMVDAAGVKSALATNSIARDNLIRLRDRIDELAKEYPHISFVSVADSVVLKSNWQVGIFDSGIKYSYEPEQFLPLVRKLDAIYLDVLGLKTYAILSQGANAYYDDPLLHISQSKNHICLNSLGLPFAQLLEIDGAARAAVKRGIHPPCDLYIEGELYDSLRFKFEFSMSKRERPKNSYISPMSSIPSVYYYSDFETISSNLR